uniref:Rap-GAP domain-containing protein n=1 Tax=Anopheles maculatus TaxID=74869 RepID=A0A182S9S7_9DIPT
HHQNRTFPQVERKRHIGNDIVNIVFIDEACSGEETEFIPNNVKSQFTHVFAVVTKRGTRYRLAVYCDETVPPFGPTLPNPPEFEVSWVRTPNRGYQFYDHHHDLVLA